MATPESEAFVRTFARGLSVIEVLGQGPGGLTLAQIAEGVDLPRTAVRRFLLTLIDLAFVRTDGKRYWLTPRVLRLGLSYLSTLPLLARCPARARRALLARQAVLRAVGARRA